MSAADTATPRGRRSVQRIGPVLITGTIVGVLESLVAISFGVLIFAGALAPHVGTGIGMALFGCVVVLVVVSLFSSLPGTIGSVQDATAAVLVVVVAGVAAQVQPDEGQLLGTVVITIAVTTGLTGVVLWLLGTFHLGQLVRYVPYPVIGGFLAGTGWLLLTGGLGLLASDDADLGALATWVDADFLVLVAPGVAVAAVLLAGQRLGRGSGFVPLVCLLAIVLFYVIVLLGPGIAVAEDAGFLLGPFPEGAFWPPDAAMLATVDFTAIASQAIGILTVVLLSAVAVLLNASGIELSTNQDGDLDRELRVAGAANLAAAAGAGIPGFHALSLTSLAHRAGVRGRGAALVAAGVVALTLIFSGDLVARAPRPVVGGLLIFLGATFLVEWLIDGWHRLLRSDYVVVVLIVVVIATVGFLEGVAVGIAATIVLFLIAYSRADVIRHALTGDAYPSRVDRPARDVAILEEAGDAITILELQGFLFFGTANRLLERIRTSLEGADEDARAPGGHRPGQEALGRRGGHRQFLVLDFERVIGLDSSTVLSFQKAAQLALRYEATIVLTGLKRQVSEQLDLGALTDLDHVHLAPELDRGVQWCEDQLLAQHGAGHATGAGTLHGQLAEGLGSTDLADRLLGYLERQRIAAGEVIVAQGERSRELYFLEFGTVTVTLSDATGQSRRLRTMMAGTVIGEIAFYLDVPRSASVVADTDGTVSRLSAEALATMQRDAPELASALHQLLARHLAGRLAGTTRTIEAMGG